LLCVMAPGAALPRLMASSSGIAPLSLTMVTAPARVGGLETVVATLSAGLAGRGHRVRIAALLDSGSDHGCDAFADLGAMGVEVRELRVQGRRYGEEVRRLVALTREEQQTVVHTHGYHSDLVGWRSARIAGHPVVSTVHGYTGGGFKNRLYEWLDRRALTQFDAVAAVSRSLARSLARSGVRESRLHTVPNACNPAVLVERGDARKRLGLPEAKVVIGWVGRLTAEKGPDVFIDAVALLPRELTGSMIGVGPLRPELEARATSAGVGNRLVWHGLVPDAGRLLAAFDVLVLSSRTEGTPIVLLEAMRSGVPVVATAVGGVPDVAPSGEIVLVPPDAPDAIAHGVADCLNETKATAARIAAARERVRASYAVGPWIDRYETIYRSLS